MWGMQLVLTSEGTQALVENIAAHEALNPADDAEFEVGLDRMEAIKFMLTDILRQAGVDTSEPTANERKARTTNPYYVAIFTEAGRKP
jgi:hypothetical protein